MLGVTSHSTRAAYLPSQFSVIFVLIGADIPHKLRRVGTLLSQSVSGAGVIVIIPPTLLSYNSPASELYTHTIPPYITSQRLLKEGHLSWYNGKAPDGA
ncbi:hypothetical protein ACLOJK_007133 [Asimina triloba]